MINRLLPTFFLLCLTACASIVNITDDPVEIITNSPEQTTRTSPTVLTPPASIKDGGFISGDPCSAPCFYGIFPGSTNVDESLAIIEKYNDLLGSCIFDYSNDTEELESVNCDNALFSFLDGFVHHIQFYPSQTITLEQVINKYGQPNKVGIWYTFYLDNPTSVFSTLFYDQIDTEILTSEQDGDEMNLNENTIIDGITYRSENEYQQFCNMLDGLILWQGYGIYGVTEP